MLIMGMHVDDLKITGERSIIEALLVHLEKAFGKLKCSWQSFVNCGINHVQDPNTYVVICEQNAYIACLKPIVSSELSSAQPEDVASPELAAMFISLLGALAYCLLTRMDLGVYVCALQRVASRPLCKHIKRLNTLTRWAQRNPRGLRYARLSLPLRLIAVSDSAFKREEDEHGHASGHAMRGCVIVRAGADPADSTSLNVQVLDYVSRKQRHVCRATFAAELFGAVDSIDALLQLCSVQYELCNGSQSLDRLRRLREDGGYGIKCWVAVDARSVFEAVTAKQIKVPAERGLHVQLLWWRELLSRGLLHGVVWVDTRDMVSDGLTKGSVDCKALHALMAGSWSIAHPLACWIPASNIT